MALNVPFPAQAKTLPISVSATASTSTALPGIGNSIRIVNEGPNHAFVSIGVGAQTATLPNATPTATSTIILSGEDVILAIPNVADTAMVAATAPAIGSVFGTPVPLNISAICRAAGTAILDVSVSEGA